MAQGFARKVLFGAPINFQRTAQGRGEKPEIARHKDVRFPASLRENSSVVIGLARPFLLQSWLKDEAQSRESKEISKV